MRSFGYTPEGGWGAGTASPRWPAARGGAGPPPGPGAGGLEFWVAIYWGIGTQIRWLLVGGEGGV